MYDEDEAEDTEEEAKDAEDTNETEEETADPKAAAEAERKAERQHQKEFQELQRKQFRQDASFFDIHVESPIEERRRKNGKEKKPGKSNAIYGFIAGLIAILFWFAGENAWFSVIFAAIGFLCTFFSKRAKYEGERFLLLGFFTEVLGAVGGAVIYLINLLGG